MTDIKFTWLLLWRLFVPLKCHVISDSYHVMSHVVDLLFFFVFCTRV